MYIQPSILQIKAKKLAEKLTEYEQLVAIGHVGISGPDG